MKLRYDTGAKPWHKKRLLVEGAAACKIGFYNVGLTDLMINGYKQQQSQVYSERLAQDLVIAFNEFRMHMLCLCELGEHEVGLDKQESFLKDIVSRVNKDGPARVRLESGQHPTYAVFIRDDPSVKITAVRYVVVQPGSEEEASRTALVIDMTYAERALTVVNVHSPANDKRKLTEPARKNVWESLMGIVGAVRGCFRASCVDHWRGFKL